MAGKKLNKDKIASLCKTCKGLIVRDAEKQTYSGTLRKYLPQVDWKFYLEKIAEELRKKNKELGQIFRNLSNTNMNTSFEKPVELDTNERNKISEKNQGDLYYLAQSNKNLEDIKCSRATLPYHGDLLDNFPQQSAFLSARSNTNFWPSTLKKSKPAPLNELDHDNLSVKGNPTLWPSTLEETKQAETGSAPLNELDLDNLSVKDNSTLWPSTLEETKQAETGPAPLNELDLDNLSVKGSPSLWQPALEETQPAQLNELDFDNYNNDKVMPAKINILKTKLLSQGDTESVSESETSSEILEVAEEELEYSNKKEAFVLKKP